MNDNQASKDFLDKARQKAKEIFTKEKVKTGANVTYQVIWNLTLVFLIIIVLGGAFAGGVGAGYFASLVKDEKPLSYESMQKDIYNYEETSEVYFANNKYLGKLRADLEREEIKVENVSQNLIDAVIATEDEYFLEHKGVVPKAIMRAVFQEVTNSSVQSGGSTLTQQLIKNQILTNEVSFDRKAKEILLAIRLERFFDKNEILEAYLNVSPLGRNAAGRNIAGVQTAAKGIFGVEANELTVPQAAFIAGLPQSPSNYTPFKRDGTLKSEEGLEPGLSRMQTVLKRMHNNDYLTDSEYEEAKSYDIVKDFIKPIKSPLDEYPYLTYEVEKRTKKILIEILAEEDGYEMEDLQENLELMEEYKVLADRNLRQNGYRIHTTIDKKIYDQMQIVKNEFQYYGSDKPEVVTNPETGEKETIMEPVEVGAILIENKTGKILSFVGGRDFEREQTNHATDARRSNGSTMKPLAVFAPALELGAISPGTIIPDVEFEMKTGDGKTWSPRNYNWRQNGLVTARVALAKSYNITAARIYLDILEQRPVKFLADMGFAALTEADYQAPALSLGGITNGVTVEENVNAFATFANGGKSINPYMVEKIEDASGNIIYEHEIKSKEVFSPQTAFLTIDMMRDVISSGTGTSLNSRLKFSSDWAGKTGTGQDWHDSWFVATNPNVSFGVWNGYDTPKPIEQSYRGLSYGVRNIYLWADLMNAAYDINPDLIAPKERFKQPGGIVNRSFCTISGLLPSKACQEAGLVKSDLFNAKYVPTEKDDSLIEGKYVEIGKKKYVALDSTPEDFAKSGVMLNPEFIERIGGSYIKDPSQILPSGDKWDNILIPDDILEENGKTPAEMKLSTKGQNLTWKKHSEKDIIGYRIYKVNSKKQSVIASIPAETDYSYKVSDGDYYITAVDIAGNESAPSKIVTLGKKEKEEPEKDKPKPEKPDKDEKPNGDKPDEKPEPPKDEDDSDQDGNEKPNNGNGQEEGDNNNSNSRR